MYERYGIVLLLVATGTVLRYVYQYLCGECCWSITDTMILIYRV